MLNVEALAHAGALASAKRVRSSDRNKALWALPGMVSAGRGTPSLLTTKEVLAEEPKKLDNVRANMYVAPFDSSLELKTTARRFLPLASAVAR
jgi:hypothetical protein